MDILKFLNALPGPCAQGLIWGIMAIGVYITYKVLDLADLTVDGTMATGGAVCIMMMQSGHSVWTSLFVAFLAGMVAGLVTGLFHTAMGIPAILAGILTQLGLYSVNLRIMGEKANQALAFGKYDQLVSLRWVKGVPFYQNTNFVAGIFVLVIIAILYWFFGTEIGSAMRATGNNEDMVRALGVDTRMTKLLSLMVSNGLVALSGALVCQSQKYGDVGSGTGAIVIGLAAIVIGEVLMGRLTSFYWKLTSVVVGSVIYFVIRAVVLRMGMDANDMKLLSAVIVALALCVPVALAKYRLRKDYSEGGEE